LSFSLLEFWRWSTSDLVDNTTRGILVEYIVGKALGVDMNLPRQAWATYNLEWDPAPGTQVANEVKSAAYLQSWHQQRYSAIQFVVPKRRGWDSETGAIEDEPRRHADVYVFALLAHKDKTSVDPLKLEQWEFYVLATRALDDRERSQHSITLNSLRQLARPSLGFDELAEVVLVAATANKRLLD